MNIVQTVAPISVIIPCYRCASTIKRAVDSVFGQSIIFAEVILVDDCSGDETLVVLWELERIYRGGIIIVQMKVNCGAASARNAGWARATQKYIAFLDADDSWHPEKLRIQYEYMRNYPDVVLCGHQCVWLRDCEIPSVLTKNQHATRISASSLLFKNAFSTPTVMLKRDVPFRFQEGKRVAEDVLLWQQIAFAGMQVKRIESPLAYVHKPLYGVSGLSAQLWEMEKGELENFIFLYQAGTISLPLCTVSGCFSIAKFIKRFFVTTLQRLVKKLLFRDVVA